MEYDREVLWLSATVEQVTPAPLPAVCLVTQCSVDRLFRLSWQAQGWPGELSVAVYIDAPLHSDAAHRERDKVRGVFEQLIRSSPQMQWRAQHWTVTLVYQLSPDQ
eukprot:7431629-Alexandrium_andersonii.AAC.1